MTMSDSLKRYFDLHMQAVLWANETTNHQTGSGGRDLQSFMKIMEEVRQIVTHLDGRVQWLETNLKRAGAKRLHASSTSSHGGGGHQLAITGSAAGSTANTTSGSPVKQRRYHTNGSVSSLQGTSSHNGNLTKLCSETQDQDRVLVEQWINNGNRNRNGLSLYDEQKADLYGFFQNYRDRYTVKWIRERIRDKYNTSADASAFCRMIRTIEMAKGSGKGQGSGAGSGGGGGSIIKVAKNATANGRDQITIVGPTDGEGSAVAMLGGGGDGPDSGHESITYIVTTSQRSAVNSKDDDQMITAHTSINPSSWGIHQ